MSPRRPLRLFAATLLTFAGLAPNGRAAPPAVASWEGPPYEPAGIDDCNGNGIPDAQDIADGTSDDNNVNGVPDECECGCVDLVLLLDITGSMDLALDNLKDEIDDVITAIGNGASGDLRLALITFKDEVFVDHALTTNVTAVRNTILTLVAVGGDGEPEASDEALREMITMDAVCVTTGAFDVPFRDDCRKRSILITDTLPGGCDDEFVEGVDDVAAALLADEAAAQEIQISAILVPTTVVKGVVDIMSNYAAVTGGRFAIVSANGSGTADAVLAAVETCSECAEVVNDCLAEQTSKLLASDGAAADQFGRSVALGRDIAIVGAELNDEAAFNGGAAYVYRRDGAAWQEHRKLAGGGLASGDFFGNAVGLSGTIAAIGAFGDDDRGNAAGAAYVFARNAGGLDQWGQIAKLLASDGGAGDQFGRSVAVDGDVIAVGAVGDDDRGSNAGAAYVFMRNQGGSNAWGQVAKLLPPDGADNDRFGTSIAVSGHTIIVGAPGRDGTLPDTGGAYVYRRHAGGFNAWGFTGMLVTAVPTPGAQLGTEVSVFGDAAALGTVNSFGCGGVAFVFRYAEGQWIEEAKLATSDVLLDDVLGGSVAIGDDVALVGAHGDASGFISTGSVFLYSYDGERWSVQTRLSASDAQSGDLIGDSAALHYGSAIAGAVGDGDTGSAYEFRGLGDCDGNGRADVCDISDGTAVDEDGDGEPDDCAGMCRRGQVRVFQESSPGAGDFEAHSVGCLDVFPTIGDAADFYSLHDGAFTGSSVMLRPNRSHLLLAGTSDGLTLVALHDRAVPPDPDGGRAEMRFALTGDGDGLTRTVTDDPGDAYTGAPGDALFTSAQAWSGAGADGLALSGLDDPWILDVSFDDVDENPATATFAGLTEWIAYSADGAQLSLALEAGRRVRLMGIVPACAADITGPGGLSDGSVDALDLLLLQNQWGSPCNGPCDADISGPMAGVPDGNVDTIDLLYLIGLWGPCS